MKKWNEFIEWAIPDLEERDFFKVYVRNILMDEDNDEKALFLYGTGANGKSVTTFLVKYILIVNGFRESVEKFGTVYFRGDNKVLFKRGVPDPSSFKGWITEKGHSAIVETNDLKHLKEGVARRSIIIHFPNVPEKSEPNLSIYLGSQSMDIENWFLS